MRSEYTPGDLLKAVDLYRFEVGRDPGADRRAEMGQFSTPPEVARFMASMLGFRGRSVRLLDAGAGHLVFITETELYAGAGRRA